MLQKIFFFSEETTTAAGESLTEASELITTEYSNLTVPTLTLVIQVVFMVLLIAVIIAGFILVKRHCVNWGYSIMTGAAAYMLFSLVVYYLVFIGISLIPGGRDKLSTDQTFYVLVAFIVGLICDCLSVYLGMMYVVAQNRKRDAYYDLGTPAIFALAIYAVSLFIGIPNSLLPASLSSSGGGLFYFFSLFSTVNTVGFDTLINNLAQNGVSSADAIEWLAACINQSAWTYVFEGFFVISRFVFFLCSSVIAYGALREKLEKKYLGLIAAFIFLSLLPMVLASFGLHTIICLAMSVVFAAAAFYYTLRIVKQQMPEELERVSHKIENNNKRNQNKNKPMPKIVMPKD